MDDVILKEELDPASILQEQNIANNKLLQQLLNQNAVLTCILAKLCEKQGIDLGKIVEELKKGREGREGI